MGKWWEPTHHFSLLQVFNYAYSQAKTCNKIIITFKRGEGNNHMLLSLYNLNNNKPRIYICVPYAHTKSSCKTSIYFLKQLLFFCKITTWLYLKMDLPEICPKYPSFISVFVLNQYAKVQIQYLVDNEWIC